MISSRMQRLFARRLIRGSEDVMGRFTINKIVMKIEFLASYISVASDNSDNYGNEESNGSLSR